MLEVTDKTIDYKTKTYTIRVTVNKEISSVYVYDKDFNILLSCLSINEAETIAREMLEVLEQLKI